jgi:LacI family transcriptional regulator
MLAQTYDVKWIFMASKRITLEDVALLAGVSSQTVSRVVNNHPYVTDETRQKVMAAIHQLDYRPNRAARSLATQQTHMLGIITYGIPHYGPAQMMSHVEQTARSRGYGVSFTTLNAISQDEMRTALDSLGYHAVDGLVIIAPISGLRYEELELLCGGLPFVQIDAELGASIPSVVIDQRYGSRLATRYLLDRGHQRIAEIHGPLNWFGALARHQSWQDTLQKAGLEADLCAGGDWTSQSGYQAMHFLLAQEKPFTALIAGNDQMALGAVRALREHGLSVPEDVSVIGFDDIPEAAFFNPPLTTIHQDFTALGEQSVEYLISRITNPNTYIEQRILYPTLVERQSVRQLK